MITLALDIIGLNKAMRANVVVTVNKNILSSESASLLAKYFVLQIRKGKYNRTILFLLG